MPSAAKEVVTLGVENDPAPAALLGKAILGRATTAVLALTTGDFAALNFNLLGRLRVALGADVGVENDPAPAALTGLGIVGRATTAVLALTTGDFAALNFDLLGQLRTVASTTSGTGLGDSFTPSEGLAASSNLVGAAVGLRYMGFSIQETVGAVARVNIRHGTGDGDPLILPVRLSANEGSSDYFGPTGVLAPDGIRVQVVSGTVDVVIFHKIVT